MRIKHKRLALGGSAIAAMSAGAGILVSGASSASTPLPTFTGAPGLTPAAALALIQKAAAGMGDNNPVDITITGPETHNQALAAADDGATVGGSYGSAGGYYVIVAHDNFTVNANDLTVPGNVVSPSGTVASMVVNGANGQVTDAGVAPAGAAPDLSGLTSATAAVTSTIPTN